MCEREGLGVVPYFSLAGGFLTGKYRSEADLAKSPRGEGAKKYLNPRGLGILKALDEVSARHSSDPAGVSLAWLLAQPVVTAPISSATSVDQLKSLIAGVQLELTGEDIALLNKASDWKQPQ